MLTAAQLASPEVHVAVPSRTTAVQWHQIEKAVEYAKSQGVMLKITKVK